MAQGDTRQSWQQVGSSPHLYLLVKRFSAPRRAGPYRTVQRLSGASNLGDLVQPAGKNVGPYATGIPRDSDHEGKMRWEFPMDFDHEQYLEFYLFFSSSSSSSSSAPNPLKDSWGILPSSSEAIGIPFGFAPNLICFQRAVP